MLKYYTVTGNRNAALIKKMLLSRMLLLRGLSVLNKKMSKDKDWELFGEYESDENETESEQNENDDNIENIAKPKTKRCV